MTQNTNTAESQPENMAQETAAEAQTPQEEAVSEADLYKDKYLRTMADLENLRKRHEKEVSDAKKYAVTAFARELLNVQDNADRALTACKADNADIKVIATGVEMMLKQFESAFAKFQIERVNAVGEPLNPDLHQVMEEVESAEAAPGTVVRELQAGYTLAGRLLRPALVVTAKAPENQN